VHKALGPRTFGDISTDGFETETLSSTTMRTASQTTDWSFESADRTKSTAMQYFTKTEVPRFVCHELIGYSALVSSGRVSQQSIQQMIASPPARENKVKSTSTGPLPTSLVLLEVKKQDVERPGLSFSITMLTKRAHIRPISSDDPIFQVPAGFTRSY